MRASFQTQITKVREVLMGYAARFGAESVETQRVVAARIWRAIPRGLGPADALAEADMAMAAWASGLLMRKVNAAELRLAMLTSGADPLQLLSHEEDVRAELALKLNPLLMVVTLPETLRDMPTQSFTKYMPTANAQALQEVRA